MGRMSAVLFSLLMVTFYSAFGDTYYVDQNHGSASNAGPGSESQPWLTVQHAADNLAAGDTVIIKGGTYNERVRNRYITGTEDAYITFLAAPGETATVQGWLLYNAYIIVDGLRIAGTGDQAEPQPGPQKHRHRRMSGGDQTGRQQLRQVTPLRCEEDQKTGSGRAPTGDRVFDPLGVPPLLLGLCGIGLAPFSQDAYVNDQSRGSCLLFTCS